MRTRATLGGRPLHAMLVPLPLGAAQTALVLDAIFLATGEAAWYAAASVALAVAAAGLVVAMVPGLVDYFTSVPRGRPGWGKATVHMAMGLALVGYFAFVAYVRFEAAPLRAPAAGWVAFAANAFGNAMLAVQGILGGELVTRHRIGVRERGDASGAGAPPRARRRGWKA